MIENPFKPITPEEDTDPTANANLVGTFLGPDAAKKYAELDAGREGKKGDDLSDLKLTDAEKAVVKEAREKEVWDRDRYIKWVESMGGDENWVDETFTFHDDGSVECGDLDLGGITELHEFPQDLKISGYLVLGSLISAKGLTLPTEIGKDLDLRNLTSAQGLKLPEKIGGFLGLDSITSANGLVLPEHVGGSIFCNSLPQTDLDSLRQRYPQHASKIRRYEED